MRVWSVASIAAQVGLLVWLLLAVEMASPVAGAQVPAPLLSAVTADGTLHVLGETGWSPLLSGLGRDAQVSDLAWHPSRPELLLIRRTIAGSNPGEPSYALVRRDLESGTEETIIDGVGPQAELVGPQYAPDGLSAYARLQCCLARELVRFGVPPQPTARTQGPAAAFLTAEAGEVSLVTAGPYVQDGRVLMSVFCCMGDEPLDNPMGLYLVQADGTASERLVRDAADGTPVGLGPSQAWAAVLEQADDDAAGNSLVRYALPGGVRTVLLAAKDVPLLPDGRMAPDGRIAVGQRRPDPNYFRGPADVWVVQPDAARRNVTAGALTDVTAFGWVAAEIVERLRASVPTAQAAPAPAPASGPRQVQVFFSKNPESLADFGAVFPVTRTANDTGVATAALKALVDGPTPAEIAQGYFSELGAMLSGASTCQGADFTLRIEEGIATVRFCRAVSSAGIGQDARVSSAINATLRQFGTIHEVRILGPDGHCLFDMSGQDRCL